MKEPLCLAQQWRQEKEGEHERNDDICKEHHAHLMEQIAGRAPGDIFDPWEHPVKGEGCNLRVRPASLDDDMSIRLGSRF